MTIGCKIFGILWAGMANKMRGKKGLIGLLTLVLHSGCSPIKHAVIVQETPFPSPEKTPPAEIKVIDKPAPFKIEKIPPPVKPSKILAPKPRPALSDAVKSLMLDAKKSAEAGDLESASATLERALRISPRNAELTYQLAVLRLKQTQWRSAEELAKKAAFLANDDKVLGQRCWRFIAQVR